MKVGVVIPCYNCEKYIGKTIQSVLNQTYPAEEIIVINDGSTDNTPGILSSFSNQIKVISQPNAGASAARNKGVNKATKSDLIAFLDADDFWRPSKLEEQVNYIKQKTDIVASGTSFSVVETGKKEQEVKFKEEDVLNYKPIDFLVSPKIHPSTLIVNGSVAKNISFPEGTVHGEDVIYATIVRSNGKIGVVEKVLVERRKHSEQITKTFQHFSKGVQTRLQWAVNNRDILGMDSEEKIFEAILAGAVKDVMDMYWARDFVRFTEMRKELISIWPEDNMIPDELTKTVPPEILVKIKDHFDRFKKIIRNMVSRSPF